MNLINFKSRKKEIEIAINKLLSKGILDEPDGYILLDGYMNYPIQNEVGGLLGAEGQSLPTIAIVGKSTGRVYTFALKILLPE